LCYVVVKLRVKHLWDLTKQNRVTSGAMTAGHWWGGYCYDRPAFPILWFLLRLHSNPDKKSIDFCSRLTGKCRTHWLELVRKSLEHFELMERGGEISWLKSWN
jgi:hypothetical protein